MSSHIPRLVAGAASLAMIFSAGAVLAPSVNAAPGSPGVPTTPKVLMHEGFGTGLSSGQLVSLEDYGTKNYTADPAWLAAAAGNGFVLDGTTTNADMVAAGYAAAPAAGGAKLRELAQALGVLNGTSPATANHAVAAYTDANPGADKVEFATKAPLSLAAAGRFLTISANVAAQNCARASAPLLKFYLVNKGVGTAVNDKALNGCASTATDAAQATTLTGGNAVLFTGDQVGIELKNENGSGSGNDHAYDDIRVLDVTPQLDKDFQASGTLRPGAVAKLVLTVTNTSELGEKKGWSFTDTLPKGIKVAGATTTDCTATVAAATGAASVKVTAGTLAMGAKSCSFTVPVTSSKVGTFTNSAANIASVGLNKPGSTKVRYAAAPKPKLTMTKSAAPTRVTHPGQVVHYKFKVKNTGNVVIRKIHIVEGSFSGSGHLRTPVCPKAKLAPGQSEVCKVNYRVTKKDARAKRINNTARAAGVAPDGKAVKSSPSSAVVRVVHLPAAPTTGARLF